MQDNSEINVSNDAEIPMIGIFWIVDGEILAVKLSPSEVPLYEGITTPTGKKSGVIGWTDDFPTPTITIQGDGSFTEKLNGNSTFTLTAVS